MTVKLVVLKTGENIITDVKEGIFDDKLICYLFEKPCTVTINGTYKVLDSDDDSSEKVSIIFRQWPELSRDNTVEVKPDFIATIVEPQEQIKLSYQTQILGNKNEYDQNFGTDEQHDSDQSN